MPASNDQTHGPVDTDAPDCDRVAFRRRRFLIAGVGIGSAAVAGCIGMGDGSADGGSPNGDDPDGEPTGTGRFRLLVSDRPAAIDDFAELNVAFEKARVFRADEDSEEGGDDDADEDRLDDDGDAPEDANQTEEDNATVEDDDAPDDPANGTASTTAEDDDGEAVGDNGGNETATDDESDADGDDTDDPDDGEHSDDDTEGEDEEDGDARGFVEIDLEGASADLTEVVGDKATEVADLPLEEGKYSSIHLYVSDVEGIASEEYDPDAHPGGGNGPNGGNGNGPPGSDENTSDGDGGEAAGTELEVKVPSEKLRIIRPFEIAADNEVAFVFDINVVRRGNGAYNLLPVIGESGIVGEDIEVDEVDG